MKRDLKQYGPNCIGQVIRIIDEQSLIIDVGSPTVSIGDQVTVYEYGEPLIDLEGNVLCHYEYTKDILSITEVTGKYSVCKKNKTRTRSILGPAISPLLDNTVIEKIPLNVQKDEIEPLSILDRLIRKGDPVKLS